MKESLRKRKTSSELAISVKQTILVED